MGQHSFSRVSLLFISTGSKIKSSNWIMSMWSVIWIFLKESSASLLKYADVPSLIVPFQLWCTPLGSFQRLCCKSKNLILKVLKSLKLRDFFDYIRNQPSYSADAEGRLMTSFVKRQRVGFWLSWIFQI